MIHVLILVGGKGTRLQTVVKDVPKPMAPIEGKPFLSYLIAHLKEQGFSKVSLLSGYKAEIIEHFFKLDSDVDVIVEEEPLGTGGAVLYGLSKIEGDQFLILNGDTFFNGSYESLLNESDNCFMMGLTEVEDVSRYGQIDLSNSRDVIKMNEKSDEKKPGLINLGAYFINKDLLQSFSVAKCSMETDILPELINNKKVKGIPLVGEFIDIGIPEDYERAQKLIPHWIKL